MLTLLLALAACSGSPDPVLDPVRQAMELAAEGESLLAAGEAEEAAARFAAARQAEEHPVLAAWQAQALAASGDDEAAAELLSEVLLQAPEFAEARYNRAASLARLGRVEDAATELSRAIALGAATAREASEDPDFAALVGHPSFSFLPATPLEATLRVPEGVAFWGSDLFVSLELRGAAEAPVSVRGPTPQAPPLEMARVVESFGTGDDPIRRLTWTLRVQGAGTGELGPLEVSAGGRSAEVAARVLEAAAPPGKAVPELDTWSWWTPSEARGGRMPPAAWLAADALWVLTPPGGAVTVEPDPGSALLMEQRDGESTSALLFRYPAPTGSLAVRVQVAGETVFEGPPVSEGR